MDRVDQYKNELERRWGTTLQYTEFKEKNRDKTKEELIEIGKQFVGIFAKFGELKKYGVDSLEVKGNINYLIDFVTEHFYTCSKKTLLRLANMYMNNQNFVDEVDKYGGEGTAEFVRESIVKWCSEE